MNIIEKSSLSTIDTCRFCNCAVCWLCSRQAEDYHYKIYNPFGCPGLYNIDLQTNFFYNNQVFYFMLTILSLILGILYILFSALFFLFFSFAYFLCRQYSLNYLNSEDKLQLNTDNIQNLSNRHDSNKNFLWCNKASYREEIIGNLNIKNTVMNNIGNENIRTKIISINQRPQLYKIKSTLKIDNKKKIGNIILEKMIHFYHFIMLLLIFFIGLAFQPFFILYMFYNYFKYLFREAKKKK